MDMKMNDHRDYEDKEQRKKCKVLYTVPDTGSGLFLKCTEEEPEKCAFSLSFGYSYLCKIQLIYTSLSITETGMQDK